jgi:hypothetical protein
VRRPFKFEETLKMKRLIFAAVSALLAVSSFAKIPAPVLTEEAKAKAAEAAAKTAYNGKLDGYKLCLSMDKASAYYYKTAQAAGKVTKPATAVPPCVDPGAFVYPPPAAPATAAAPAAPAATAPAAAASPAAAVAAPAKKI